MLDPSDGVLLEQLSSRSHGWCIKYVPGQPRVRKCGRPGSLEAAILAELGGRAGIPPLLSMLENGEDIDGSVIELPYLDDRRAATEAELRLLVADLAASLDTLHEAGYVHRDLKRSNVRFDGRQAWLIDFDLAERWRDGDAPLLGQAGTLGWRAPEVRLGLPHSGAAADMWSLGLLVWDELSAMLAGHDSAVSPLQLCWLHR